jgi:ubiquinone/menaquinone biosynthesis C-methylase UbiE
MNELGRLAHGLRQTARIGWFWGHYLLTRRLAGTARSGAPDTDPAQRRRRAAARRALRQGMAALMTRDLRNIDAGHYGVAAAAGARPLALLGDGLAYLADLPRVTRRRKAGDGHEVARSGNGGDYPAYFLQNFHYQTGGYLTRESARLYDFQVEVLFTGLADTMRRQGLVPVADVVRRRGASGIRLLDVGCGTGRFLEMAAATWPGMTLSGLDLSSAYLAEAGARLRDRSVGLIQGNAEAIPADDASFDVVSSVFLLHELPPEARARAVVEMARVLAPGGILVLIDSLQPGDTPALDPLLDSFPDSFHEPYYRDYLGTDLPAVIKSAGLIVMSARPAWLAKVVESKKSP